MRRHRVPRPGARDSEFYTVEDLNVGNELTVYARHFKLVDCDQFTRNFLTKLGVQVNHPQPIPGDPYSDQRRMVGHLYSLHCSDSVLNLLPSTGREISCRVKAQVWLIVTVAAHAGLILH